MGISLSLTIDLDPGDAPDFMAKLSEAFRSLKAAVSQVTAPVSRGTVAPQPPPAPDKPAEAPLPQPAPSAAADAPSAPTKPGPGRPRKVPAAETSAPTKPAQEPASAAPAAPDDLIEGLNDAELLVALRAAGNQVVKTPGLGSQAVMNELKKHGATAYPQLAVDAKREVLRKLNAVLSGN